MRLILSIVLGVCLAGPALAGPPYIPLPLKPAETVTPPEDLIADATAFLKAIKSGDGDAIALGMAPRIVTVDGALELALPRHKETVGPFDTIEAQLAELASAIGGDVQPSDDPATALRLRIDAERDYIAGSLSDDQQWGRDPMLKGAICTYGYRSFDIKKLKALADKTGTSSSSFVYVDAPYGLRAAVDKDAEVVFTMETDRLYALDYDTDAPGRWIAVHLPGGGSGFANFDEVDLQKPYASGICFDKGKDGHWVMVGQTSTSL